MIWEMFWLFSDSEAPQMDNLVCREIKIGEKIFHYGLISLCENWMLLTYKGEEYSFSGPDGSPTGPEGP